MSNTKIPEMPARIGYDAFARTAHSTKRIIGLSPGQNSLALTCIEQAIAGDSGKPHYHYNLGLVLEIEERWEEAILTYGEALAINPTYVEALANLGDLYRRQRRWTDAITTLQHALRLKPQSADIHNTLGVTCKEQGELETALGHYQQALKLSPQHVKL